MFSRISYQLKTVQKEAVWEGVISKESKWAFPEEGSIKMNLEEVYKDHGRFKKRASELQKWICREFTQKKKYAEFVEHIKPFFADVSEEVDDLFNELSVEQ